MVKPSAFLTRGAKPDARSKKTHAGCRLGHLGWFIRSLGGCRSPDPPLVPGGAPAPQTPMDGVLPPPPSQHVFLFDRAFGWEGLPGVPEGPPSLKQIVNTGQSSAIVTPGRSPCDRAPCRPNCFGRSANDTGRIPKWSATVWVQPPAGDLGGGSPPTRGVWGAGAPPEYRKCSIGRNTATRTHTLK